MRLYPRSLAGQLAVFLLVALVVAQAAAFVLFAGERARAARFAYQENVLARAATLVRLVEDTPAAVHGDLLEAASTRLVRFSRDGEPVAGEAGGRMETWLARDLADALDLPPDAVRASVVRDAGNEGPGAWWRGVERERWRERRGERRRAMRPVTWINLSVALPDATWLNVVAGRPPGPPPFAPAFLASLALSVAATGAVALLAGRRLGRPMRRLADAAERFGRGESVAPLAEQGPEEARRSARAFNEMRERLDRFVGDRTHMLAAISHDLRTPLTSLRLRAEMVDDAETRDRLIETIEEMREMADAALAFARAEADGEDTRLIDIASLVDSLAEDMAELGHDVRVDVAEAGALRCRPGEVRRALRNLVENAVRYGQRARIAVARDATSVRVHVDDDGPGIDEGDRERVFEPFVRLETSRSRETGGMGLGLAIARGLVRRHGGDIALSAAPGGGLRATMVLPAGA